MKKLCQKLLIIKRLAVFGFLLILFSGVALAQNLTIRGVVTNSSTNEPMPGVNIVVKGTTNGTLTNADGSYSINAPNGSTLLLTFIGFKNKEVPISGNTTINVLLEEALTGLDEVIVTGYSTQRKIDLTGAVAVVRTDDIKNTSSSNVVTSLQGRIPGVFIEKDGRPNGGQRTFLIRGLNTLGNTSPLIIIDGIPTVNQGAFQDMDPELIESVQVLKDATSASIYGSRASNGVVIVTTKKGKDKLEVKFNSSYSMELFTDKLPVLNTIERGQVLWQASINDKTPVTAHQALYTYESHLDNGVAVLDKVIPAPWIGGSESLLTPGSNTDWQNEVFKTGQVLNNDLSISYGNNNVNALFGMNYLDNQGTMKYMQFRKYGARLNTSFSFLDGKIKIGENLQISKTRDTPDRTDLGNSDMVNLARFEQPILPVYTTTGGWSGPIGAGFSDRNNPLHMLYIYRNNFQHTLKTFGNAYLEIKPINNLLFRSSFGIEYLEGYYSAMYPSFQTGFLGRTINYMTVDQNHRLNWTWSNVATYDATFGAHNINFLLGIEAIKNSYLTMAAYKEGFAIEDLNYYYLGAGTGASTNGGTGTGNQLLSYFAKVNYNYNDKYLVALTVRQDGSSRFGTENRYGIFPSVSVGWRLNKESFLSSLTFISNLKIRGGWGKVGNQEIGDESRFNIYATNYGTIVNRRTTGTAYDLNGAGTGNLPSGYAQIQQGNPNLRWESTTEINGGIDFGFMQEKFFGTFDYFSRKTSDILIQPPYVAFIGEGGGQWQNGATVDNKGFEATFGYRNKVGKLTYSIGINVGAFHDKVVKLPASVVRAYPGNVEKTIIGHSPREMFGYIVEGIFQDQAEVDGAATQPGKGIGRLHYKDLNGDGKIDPLDQDWLGNSLPKAEYGINAQLGYNGFDLSFFIQGIYGRKVNNSILGSTDFISNGMNMGRRVLEAWTPQNTGSTIPMLSLVNANNETRTSTYFIQSGDYIKLRNAVLGYTLPKELTSKVNIQQVRVFVLGENLVTVFKKKGKNAYTAMDPSLPGNPYPLPTGITFGLNLTF